MTHSEAFEHHVSQELWKEIQSALNASDNDAQLIFWGPEEDISTALETIEERCKLAFEGVPRETRKTFPDGTTVFERVLPGPDRMYPDTDSAPIPLDKKYIDNKWQQIPEEIISRYQQLKKWGIPEDTYNYIFSKNLYPLIQKITNQLNYNPKFIGCFLGHTLKFVEGHYPKSKHFDYNHIFKLFSYLQKQSLTPEIAKRMLPFVYKNPERSYNEILELIGYKKSAINDLTSQIPELRKQFEQLKVNHTKDKTTSINWIMGQLHPKALGNTPLKQVRDEVEKQI